MHAAKCRWADAGGCERSELGDGGAQMPSFASKLDGTVFMREHSAHESIRERIERVLCAIVLLAALMAAVAGCAPASS
jgi:hypothetical protein